MRKNKKRILSILFAVFMVIAMLPFGSFADGATGNSTLSRVISDQDSAPSGFYDDLVSNPYGLVPGASDPTLMMKAHEVLLYKTTKHSSNLSGENGIYIAEYTLPSFTDGVDDTKYSS